VPAPIPRASRGRGGDPMVQPSVPGVRFSPVRHGANPLYHLACQARPCPSPRGHCAYRDHGQLPDPCCTPGSIDPAVTQADIRSTAAGDTVKGTVGTASCSTTA
jgi:hypothetical protein